MKSSQNLPKTFAIVLRAAVKELRETGVPTVFGAPVARNNIERAVNAIDRIEGAAAGLEEMAGEGPSDGEMLAFMCANRTAQYRAGHRHNLAVWDIDNGTWRHSHGANWKEAITKAMRAASEQASEVANG